MCLVALVGGITQRLLAMPTLFSILLTDTLTPHLPTESLMM